MKYYHRSRQAFTLTELLVVIAVVAILAFTLLPAIAASKSKAQKINCINNLKQVGFAYNSWQGANSGRLPQAITAALGGASDYCSHGGNAANNGTPATIAYNPGMVYMVMSNYLVNPRLLFCPADTIHSGSATNYSYNDLLSIPTPASHANAPALSAFTKVSYFVGADATQADPQSILAGDCNIGNQTSTANSSPATYRFGMASANSSTLTVGSANPEIYGSTPFSGTANGSWSWTAYDLHQKTGNLLIADGSVQSGTISGLHVFMQNATNSVMGPCWNFLP